MQVVCTVPLPPSANHSYRRAWIGKGEKKRLAQVLTDKAKAWMEECALRARLTCRKALWSMTEPGVKVVVELRVFWPDDRTHDMNNLHKLTADALEGVVYANDRYALLRDMDFEIDRANPRLELTWYPLVEARRAS